MDKIELITLITAALLILVMIITVFLLSHSQRRNEDAMLLLRKEIQEDRKRQDQMNLSMINSVADVKTSMNREFIDFSSRINRDFDDLNERTTTRLLQMEGRIRSDLTDSSSKNDEVFTQIIEKISRLDEAQKEFKDLSKDIASLQDVLLDKKTRGIFGEVELYNLLENVLGEEGILYKKQMKLSNGSIADAAVMAGEKIGLICIDSKFPLENYRRMYDETLERSEREKAAKLFEGDVRKHITDIRDKYIIPGETADMAYMFLPAEAIYSEIYAHYDRLVDYSYRSRVFLVSPTTLVAYLTAIKNIYLGMKKYEKAEEIERLLRDLSQDFALYKKRNDNLQKHFLDLTDDFHDLQVTSGKIMRRFDSLIEGEFDESE